MEGIVVEYLKHLKIPVSKKYFEKCVLSHPDYPSLLSIADTLERIGISHQIGQIEEEHLSRVAFPYMLQLDRHVAELLLIKNQQDLDKHKKDLRYWEGVIIKLEPTDAIANKEHEKQLLQENRQQVLFIVLLVTLIGLLIMPLLKVGLGVTTLLLATSLTGIAVGYFLLAKDLGITYKPVESFCNAGNRTNCDRILNSEEATLIGTFTFSDAAACYFGWQLIILGFFIPLFTDGTSYLATLAVASVFTIPIIGYSLYYQYAVAKTWCLLCLIIDGILATQFGLYSFIYAIGIFSGVNLALIPTINAFLLFMVIASSVFLLKERLQTLKTSTRAETAAKRVKFDPEIFTHILLKQQHLDIKPFEREITIGNPKANVQILMIANLHCNPCGIAFETMSQLISIYPEKIGLSIRFTQGMNKTIRDLSASSYLIRYWQHFIYGHENEYNRTQTFIGDWYDRMNPETFSNMYPSNGGLDIKREETKLLEDYHYQWVTNNKIANTPTFFVNGYKLPRSYSIGDLMPMLPGLSTLFKEQIITKLNGKALA